MPYLTDTASRPDSVTQTEAADQRWAAHLRFAPGRDAPADGWAGMRADPGDGGLGAARGIAIAILLALPVWGAVALAVRWLLAS